MTAAPVLTPAPVRVAFPAALPEKDGGQAQVRGAAVGCGPLSAACLVRAHAARLGVALPERDDLAAELLRAQGAFRVPGSGGQRATWPWRWVGGLNAYLRAHDLPLRARGQWGPGQALEGRLEALFAQGTPVVGLEFSPGQQHYGLVRAYTPGGELQAELHANGRLLRLRPSLGLGGLFWLEEEG
ncbi:hypothetical protein GO986_21500 [Deinococcus sp. HMF7620]|uniref:Peptidase C39-like domain-containing protein n=1 Tax=Deinococcus arboris TaxID=2682977 RepID=A0A7C9I2A3_9DEIO|nr:hypothetical protein [Deinococcus arboris]MVN89315.1 hypothetical protein [Deinococcus arboris]